MLQHEAWLRRLARSLVMDDTRADDVVQQVWLKALESRPNSERDLRPWLKAVARNVAFNLRRADSRRSRREKDSSREETLADRAFYEESETRKLLLAAVQQIKEPYRSTLLLHYYEEMSLEDIARRLRIPGATVRTRLRRALEQVRSLLDERYGDRQSWGLLLFPVCWKGADLSWSSGAALASQSAKPTGLAKLAAAKSLWGIAAAVFVAPVVITLGLTAPASQEAAPTSSSTTTALSSSSAPGGGPGANLSSPNANPPGPGSRTRPRREANPAGNPPTTEAEPAKPSANPAQPADPSNPPSPTFSTTAADRIKN